MRKSANRMSQAASQSKGLNKPASTEQMAVPKTESGSATGSKTPSKEISKEEKKAARESKKAEKAAEKVAERQKKEDERVAKKTLAEIKKLESQMSQNRSGTAAIGKKDTAEEQRLKQLAQSTDDNSNDDLGRIQIFDKAPMNMPAMEAHKFGHKKDSLSVQGYFAHPVHAKTANQGLVTERTVSKTSTASFATVQSQETPRIIFLLHRQFCQDAAYCFTLLRLQYVAKIADGYSAATFPKC